MTVSIKQNDKKGTCFLFNFFTSITTVMHIFNLGIDLLFFQFLKIQYPSKIRSKISNLKLFSNTCIIIIFNSLEETKLHL